MSDLITRRYRDAFTADRELKAKVLRLERALKPPRPKARGRPPNPTVTHALRLYANFRRRHPQETRQATWARVYPIAIPGYDAMTEIEQRIARDELRERVSWRRRRKPRRIAAQFTV